jgi:hypothetical protein
MAVPGAETLDELLSRLRNSLPVLKNGSAFAETNTAAPVKDLTKARYVDRFFLKANRFQNSPQMGRSATEFVEIDLLTLREP